MALQEFIAASVLFGQIGCVADMLFRGRTLPMPGAGGASMVISRNESVVGFYVLLSIWVVLFVIIDVIVLSK